MEKNEEEVVSDIFNSLLKIEKLLTYLALTFIVGFATLGVLLIKVHAYQNALIFAIPITFILMDLLPVLKLRKMLLLRKNQFSLKTK